MPILVCLWQFAPTASHLLGLQQVSFHTIHQGWHIIPIQRLSPALKNSAIQVSSLFLLKTLQQIWKTSLWSIISLNFVGLITSTHAFIFPPLIASGATKSFLHSDWDYSSPCILNLSSRLTQLCWSQSNFLSLSACAGCPPDMTIASISYEMSHEPHPAFPQVLLHLYLELSTIRFPIKF